MKNGRGFFSKVFGSLGGGAIAAPILFVMGCIIGGPMCGLFCVVCVAVWIVGAWLFLKITRNE